VHIAHYLGLLHRAQADLGDAFAQVGDGHAEEQDVLHLCRKLAADCRRHADLLEPFVARYGEEAPDEPDRLHAEIFQAPREGGLGLLRDLYLMAAQCEMAWTLIGQAAQGLRDHDLLEVVRSCEGETAMQMKWLRTRMKQAAPQALVVA